MNFDIPKRSKELPPQEKLEMTLESEADFEKLEKWLASFMSQDEAGQCVFVLRSISGESFLNQCQDATQTFGRGLAENFGDEESFFEIAKDVRYSDVRTSDPLDKIGRRGLAHHSVGLLELNSKNKSLQSFVVFDLNYGRVAVSGDRKSILVIHSQGDKEQALEKLKNHYGGKWQVNYELDAKNDRFVFRGV